jgi:hypothetical protein
MRITTEGFFIALIAGVACGVVFMIWHDHTVRKSVPFSKTLRDLPLQKISTASAIASSIFTILFYEAFLIFASTESYKPFTEAMSPIFYFLGWWLGASGAVSVMDRFATKPEVVKQQGEAEAKKIVAEAEAKVILKQTGEHTTDG